MNMIRPILLLSMALLAVQSHALRAAADVPPCENPINRGALFCNVSATLDARVADLLSRLPLNETPALFMNGALGAASIGMPPYQWWSEGLHGVAYSPGVNFGGNFPAATSFPQVCTTAASFNTTLFAHIGDVVGREGRAMNNHNRAGLTYWAPNINIFRDPRWGRGQETPGEDPLLTSRYAHHFVRNMQNNSMDPSHLRVSSCCKHYLAYDMEDSDGFSRHDFDAIVSQYDFENTYLVAFQSCMHQNGGASSGVMCSYNAENGVPSCANSKFLTDVARKEWGFNGYITSDCGAVSDVMDQHHYTSTADATLNATLSAGMDIDCGTLVSLDLMHAVSSGTLPKATVYEALKHTFSVLMRLGYFDPESAQPYKSLGPADVNTPAAQKLALEAAEQGIVLLNYNTSYLPWSRTAVRNIAVLGNNADNENAQQGNYYGHAPYVITPRDALSKMANVSYLQVLSNAQDTSTQYFAQACAMAKSADTTLLVIGNDQLVESEGHDRVRIGFPGNQDLLVHTVANCASQVGKQITVVAFSGGSLDYSMIKSEPGVGAILWAGYPGQSGGQALANILFGLISPSGRLPTTVYPSNFVEAVAMTNMQMEANATTGSPGFTYRYYTGNVVYPFGWGLTYTNWSLVPIQMKMHSSLGSKIDELLREHVHDLRTEVHVGSLLINITNTGTRASSFTLLLKVTVEPPGPVVGGTLSDFQKVFLEPGESKSVELGISAPSVSFDGMKTARRGKYALRIDDEIHGYFTIADE